MSFADQVRAELAEGIVKKPCCRRALGAGFLLVAKRTSASHISLRCRWETSASLAAATLEKNYSKKAEILLTGDHGHRYRDISFDSPAAAKLVSALQASDADLDTLLHLSACEGCRSAFLRGLFFASGTVNDPERSSHLEFLIPAFVPVDGVIAFLNSLGYPPKRIGRSAGVGLYYKDGTSVGDLITLMGSHSIIFAFYNARIARDIRNNENRATNCVAKNIEKSIQAAARQMEAIGKLMESGRLETLPEPLKITALLRYRNPDASLDELKELHTPPISKSGLNHRLQKLMDAAEQSKESL